MHTLEIVEYKQLSDSEFAVLLRCCDPCEKCATNAEEGKCKCHLHWHTMHSSVVNDETKHTNSIQRAANLAAANHEAALQAVAKIKPLIGSKLSPEPQE